MYINNRELYGPYTFRKACAEQECLRVFGVLTIILKEVVNTEGGMVR